LKLEIKKRNIKIIYPWLINSFGERSLEVNWNDSGKNLTEMEDGFKGSWGGRGYKLW